MIVDHYRSFQNGHKKLFVTSLARFIEENSIRLILGVQDILRAIDAQVTTSRGLVIACQSASACLSVFVASFHALDFWYFLQRCIACRQFLSLCKFCNYTLNVCRTQRNCQKIDHWNLQEMFYTENHGCVWVATRETSNILLLLKFNCAD